jgi:hypothetical protein
MSFRIFIILLLLPVTCYSQGEDHLVPEDSVYADQASIEYDILVSRIFGKYIPYTYLKMIATPTARNEYAISINQEANVCNVSYLESKHYLWLYELLKGNDEIEKDPEIKKILSELPDDPHKMPVIEHTASLENDACNRIASVWNKTLLNTRYPEITDEFVIGVDGTEYHFSTWILGHGTISGKAWSPDPSKIPGKLVALVNAIGFYARESTLTNKKKLNKAIKELEDVYK